jgi:hypothetical protein
MKSIAILTCWYGTYPWYFSYFVYSCSCNPTVNFFIITDNQQPIASIPKNVKVVYKTLEEIKTNASEKLSLKVKFDDPYQLCDFKPAYGFIFPELIKDYDFWGYGDIDVIYGNLRYFLTNELLEAFDVFSFRPEYLTGSLSIYRNGKKNNELFMQSRDYKTVFSDSKYFNFDECNFMFVPLWNGKSIEDIPYQIESMTHLVMRKMKEGYLRGYFDFNLIEGTVGNIKWTNGKIIYKNQFEAILYHLLKFKDRYQHHYQLTHIEDSKTIFFSKNNIYKRNI